MPGAILQALYEGRRADAVSLATGKVLDVFEAAALADLTALRAALARDGAPRAWSDDGFTPLHLACFFGTPEAVTLLVEAGAEVDVPSRNVAAVRPLHSAVAGSHPSASARVLLEAGAQPDARQASGHRPMDAALARGDEELAALLRAHGASA